VNSEEFSNIRHYLGISQSKLAQLLCVSLKAVQSFEQNWRNIPVYIERQLFLLMSRKQSGRKELKPCWEIKKCDKKCKERCIVWEYKSDYCWLISGIMHEGKAQKNWGQKIKICQKCSVFREIMPSEISNEK
jgi:hypothetical protein